MSWLNTTVMVFHVLLAVGLVGLVLLQRGKGADAGAGFGAGASGTVFGARGSASFLSRTTAVLALLFFVSSLTLAYLGSRHAAPTSVVDRMQSPAPESAAKDAKTSQTSSETPDEIPGVPAEQSNPTSKNPVEAPGGPPAPAPAKN